MARYSHTISSMWINHDTIICINLTNRIEAILVAAAAGKKAKLLQCLKCRIC